MGEYCGRTASYSHKFDDWKDKPADGHPALSKQWFLDVQWSDLPVEVEGVVKSLWRLHELGNDKYIIKTSLESLHEWYVLDGPVQVQVWKGMPDGWVKEDFDVSPLTKYLEDQGVKVGEQIIIHWWW